MPIYVFKCPKHKIPEDHLQRVDELPPRCKACGSLMEKQPTSGSFQLKGAGFHRNDYGN